MATKVLTDEYLNLRRQYARIHLNGSGNPSSDGLMLSVADEPDSTPTLNMASAQRLVNVQIPFWLRTIKPIEEALQAVHVQIGELRELHSKQLHSGFGDNTGAEAAVKSKTKKITAVMRDIKQVIVELSSDTSMSPQETYMRDNIQKLLATRLQDEGTYLRREQVQFQSQLSNTKSKPSVDSGRSSPLVFDRPVQLDEEEDEENEDMSKYDKGFTGAQQARVQVNIIRIDQRMREIREIAQSIEELGAIMQDIANMVHQQGSLLDTIEYNIDNADHSVQQGKKDLEYVVKGEKGFSKWLCFLMLLIIVIGSIVIAIIIVKG